MQPADPIIPATCNAPDLAKLSLEAVENLQVAWQNQDWAAVGNLFHPAAMLLPPDMGPIIHSRAEIVASYQEFMAQAQMHTFAMTRCEVQPFATSCMVQCGFDIAFTLGAQRETSQLQEIYLLERHEVAGVQIVWRQQLLDTGMPGEHL